MGDKRLKMSLDDIITSNDKKGSRGNSKSIATAGKRGNSTRDQRKISLHAAPNSGNRNSRNDGSSSSSSSSGNRPMSKLAQLHKACNSDVSMKFLLKNSECGKLIGTNGNTKDELMEITGATIHISSYTGTGDARCVYITGKDSEVSLCCCMLWELIGYCTANTDSSSGWKPSIARKTPGAFDDEEVEGEICIPAHLAGAEESDGVTLVVSDKNEVDDKLQERIVSMAGTTAGCMSATDLILKKLKAAELNGYEYAVKSSWRG